mmetsp:Transcript_11274/g.21513  ORF Transcript_11274/g.21513 Transcript_11274/m.21513 type:complete len:647 (+) Transcript_11274:141-2081(+)|eukprot:scaffold3823_cov195-Amphora_coffeaeformis.AAC.37
MTDDSEKVEDVKRDPEDEERRLRERLKARAAARSGGGDDDRSEDRHSSPRSQSHDQEEGGGGRRDRHLHHGRGGGGGHHHHHPRHHPRRHHHHQRGGPPPPRYRDQGRYRPYPSPRRGSNSSERGAPRRHSNNNNTHTEEEEDDFGRRRRPPSPVRGGGGRPRSHSGSSRSYSSGDRGRSRSSRGRRRSRSRSVSSHSYSSYSSSDSSRSSSSASSVSSAEEGTSQSQDPQAKLYSKDQRTVFVQQLVQRTTEKDIKRFFKTEELKVNEVILLRDKRTGRHKGCAYVEMRRMEDVPKAVALSNQVPSFQRFPILVKASEAEKNYLSQVAAPTNTPLTAAQVVQTGSLPVTTTNLMAKPPPLISPNGKLLESQKVYVGSLDPSVTQEHLFLLYSQFGYLDKVALQMDTTTGMSKGFAFLSFHDPKDAFLAIQTMAGQVLAGRPMKTGWAVNQIPSIPGSEIVMSEEFPPDASQRTTNAYRVLAQLTMGVGLAQIRQGLVTGETAAAPAAASRVPTVADARASLAATVAAVPVPAAVTAPPLAAVTATAPMMDTKPPTPYILVHNMYDKDEETEPGWETEIKDEFEEECSQYGKILGVKVMSKEPGGKIYASFDTADGAQKCASSIAGRWFNKRQLRVQFVSKEDIPA